MDETRHAGQRMREGRVLLSAGVSSDPHLGNGSAVYAASQAIWLSADVEQTTRSMNKQIGRQRLRLAKRVILAPIAPSAQRWALSGEATSVKNFVLRHVVLTGLAAARRPFERSVGSDLVFRANSEDFLPVMILMFGVWEPVLTQFLRRRLKPGRVFVDVGANLGWFTSNAARWVGSSGTVVAIEAAPALFEKLVAQVKANDLDNVRTVNEAAGATSGRVRIQPGPAAHTGLTRVVPSLSASVDEVPLRPLPSILTEDEIARCRAIKIDVEGSEYDVVRGMETLFPLLPADAEIIVEVGPERAASPTDVTELFDIFRAHGFHPYIVPNTYTVAAYRDPVFPETLDRLHRLPTQETDVVFSRADQPHLAF
ncbi:MAG: FkbM family methyltransferase [Actinobacteria bacterium]|nr:FkbM family methyltransferase [Actinomycetota bacterium]